MIENLFGGGGGGGGTVDTVQAGTGISVNSTDPANPIVTLGNHDASLITTGTIATARLGTGTANSSTYLAGDQTYKAAVTSVNGATGAVVIGAGDTTYSMTITDAENTTALTNLVSFTVPANTWADGEYIYLEVTCILSNTTGSANYTQSLTIGGTTHSTSGTATVGAAETYGQKFMHWFYRQGSNVRALSFSGQPHTAFALPTLGGGLATSTYSNLNGGATVAATFTSNITINFRGQWTAADPARFQRIMNARAWKPSGQQT